MKLRRLPFNDYTPPEYLDGTLRKPDTLSYLGLDRRSTFAFEGKT